MRVRRPAVVLTTALLGALLTGAPASANTVGDTEGCTPGYWKNHTDNWYEVRGGQLIPTSTPLKDPRLFAATEGTRLGEQTMLQALSFKGGSGVEGAQRILLRAAVASWLNSAHEDLAYPLRRFSPGGTLDEVNAALRSGDRARMLDLAEKLDRWNNLGCPLT